MGITNKPLSLLGYRLFIENWNINMSKFEIKHELVKTDGKIEVKRFSPKGRDHYHIKVFISGALDRIEYVSYELHPTFNSPNRVSNDQSERFCIDFWTWGEFDMTAIVYLKNGSVKEVSHYLSYSDELPAEDSAYLYVSESKYRG